MAPPTYLPTKRQPVPGLDPSSQTRPGVAAHERGQSLVEFALLLPVLLLILLGAVDLARVYTTQVTITNAAREGARFGAANRTNTPEIQNKAVQEASSSGVAISTSDVAVACFPFAGNTPFASCIDSGIVAGDRLRVTVTHAFPLITGGILGFGALTLSNSATMVITN